MVSTMVPKGCSLKNMPKFFSPDEKKPTPPRQCDLILREIGDLSTVLSTIEWVRMHAEEKRLSTQGVMRLYQLCIFSFGERDRKSKSSSRNCCSSLSERVIISRRVIEQIIFDCEHNIVVDTFE
jgi:hypothetical protein